jgi:biopolymer transport protein ExbB/TolQ
MDLTQTVNVFGYLIYSVQGALFLWGVLCLVLIYLQTGRRQFRTTDAATAFLVQLREILRAGDFDSAKKLCAEPEYWYRAVSVLSGTAIENRHLAAAQIRQVVAARFDREIISDMEHRLAWVNTVIKSEPMLGLLGTVLGMIGAFAKIGRENITAEGLGGEISVALYTTAIGLGFAVPLLLAAHFIQVRMRKLEDSTVEHFQAVLDDLESARSPSKSPPP